MWPRLRQAAVIAVLLLASILLSQDTATSSGGPVAAPTPQAHHHAGAATDKTVRAAQPQPFAFADVQQLAQQRAAHDYRPMPDALPAALANLSYDQYRDIRFRPERDRKSTRLNSSHSQISYAVFCLKKKKRTKSQYRYVKQYVIIDRACTEVVCVTVGFISNDGVRGGVRAMGV